MNSTPNKFCKMLKIIHPIIQAPMAGGISTPQLAASVANFGGLGVIAAGYLSLEKLSSQIKEYKTLSDKPFMVNMFIPEKPSENFVSSAYLEKMQQVYKYFNKDFQKMPSPKPDDIDAMIEICIAESVSAVSSTFGCFSDNQIKYLKKNNLFVIGTATSEQEAVILENLKYDAIILQGFEAGGHRGTFAHDALPQIGLLSLLQLTSNLIQIPLIASGGISSGKAIAACLCLGASAVQIGTLFLLSDEAGSTQLYKEKVIDASGSDTILTKVFSGKYARGIQNKFINELANVDIPLYPFQNAQTSSLRDIAKKENNYDYMSLWSGQTGSLGKMQSAENILTKLIKELESVKI